jgi:hypothetical protein
MKINPPTTTGHANNGILHRRKSWSPLVEMSSIIFEIEGQFFARDYQNPFTAYLDYKTWLGIQQTICTIKWNRFYSQ